MKQVNFAIVGCGRVSSRHVDALSLRVPGAQITAVCDTVGERADKYGSALNVPSFVSTRDMYESADINVVTIATPSGDHYSRAMEAINHGKHVVVEKPVALRLEQVDEMIAAANQQGVQLWVAHQNRYNPAVVKAKEVIDSGRLGKLVVGTVRVRWCRTQSYYDGDDWHGTWEMDGGVLSQQAIHHLDALRWFMGAVETVDANCATSLVDMECEDLCIAKIKFANGALGVVEAMTAARPRDLEASISILGENGSIILGGIAMNKIDFWEFSSARSEDQWVPELFSQDVPNAYGYGHDVLYSRVVESLLHGAPIEIPGEEGRKALEFLHAIYASNEQGRPVHLPDRPASAKLGMKSAYRKKSRCSTMLEDPASALQSNLANNIDSALLRGKFTGIIGDFPSMYAKSPTIWNSTFRQLDIDVRFLPFDVEFKNLARIVDVLKASKNFLGGSVTVPYKIEIMKHLDEVDSKARQIGAVNTIVREPSGRLVGYNTDGRGAIDALLMKLPGQKESFCETLKGMSVLVVGGGGAARAVACNVCDEIGPSGRLALINRTDEKSMLLATELSCVYGNVSAESYARLPDIAKGFDLVINCTICGQGGVRKISEGEVIIMEPYSFLHYASPSPVSISDSRTTSDLYHECVRKSMEDIRTNNQRSFDSLLNFPRDTKIYDIVYSPTETVALRQARFCGIAAINGKGMNICQAADAMFNKVMRRFLEERGMANESTNNRILEAMYNCW